MNGGTFIAMFLAWTGTSDGTISKALQYPIEMPVKEISGTNFAASESGPNPGRLSDAETGHYFRVVSDMHNQSLVSGGKAQFRCKVEGFPMDNLKFTWYKGNKVITIGDDPRIAIRQKNGVSRLQINDVFTADSGLYRCESTNGERRVATKAFLEVSFVRPPPPGEGEILEPIIPSGKCELYDGLACGAYLTGKYVYIDPYQTQLEVEKSISIALNRITDPKIVSNSCQRYAFPALCYFVFPVCEDANDIIATLRGKKPKPEERATRLCREDCELLMHDVCKDEFANPEEDVFMEQIAATANCSQLPPTTAGGTNCMRVGLPSVVKKKHTCYNDTGKNYRGTQRKTLSGITCKSWPLDLVQKNTELSGGHNFCRNPGNTEDRPWCFIDKARKTREVCDISKCVTPSSGSQMITILIPSVAIPLLIGCIVATVFFCRRGNRGRRMHKGIKGKPVYSGSSVETAEMMLAPTKNIVQIPHISPQALNFTMHLGDGQFGKVYKAQLSQNTTFSASYPVAVKTLNEGAMNCHIEEFQKETEIFAELQHPNIACLKAVVTHPNHRCMVFEYTNRIDLHEYLSLHSPHSDVGISVKAASSVSSQASGSLESSDFINMMTQIASGMDYLSSRNYVHRDLATRNILVCQNNILKICNLGVVRDCYLSSYYRSPQGGNMLPIRWMAPESMTTNTFSTRASVWSFGVLVWEIYSYGLQPYCGYSNQEVFEMITRFQQLACPDQCPARVYSLMHECWAQNPIDRPNFKDIYAKLCGWGGANGARVTSQLARGIHRQLANVISDGQYGQYSGMDSASIPSYDSPSPPPTYNAVTGNLQQQYLQHAAAHVSHAVFNQPGAVATSTAPIYGGQRFVVDAQNAQEPNPSYSQTRFVGNEETNFPQRYYAEQNQAFVSGGTRWPAQVSHSTSSCASSNSEYGPVVRRNSTGFVGQGHNLPQHQTFPYGAQKQKFYGGIDGPTTAQHYPLQVIPRRRLSGVMEDEATAEHLNPQRLSLPSAAVAPYSVTGGLSDNGDLTSSAKDSCRTNNHGAKTEVMAFKSQKEESDSSTSSSSAKAPSCDSGLPVDDDPLEALGSQIQVDHPTNVTSPLIAPRPYVSKTLSVRSTPNKDTTERNSNSQ